MRCLLLSVILTLAAGAAEDGVRTATFHLDHAVAAPGDEVLLVLQLELTPGWHVYWRNPGDSGMPTRLSATPPAGVTAGEPLWPVPQRFVSGGVIGFGYVDELLLGLPLHVAPDAAPGTRRIAVEAGWLACLEACIPGSHRAEIELVVGDEPRPAPAGAALARRLVGSLPVREAPWRCTGQVAATTIAIDLHPLVEDPDRPEYLAFVPATEGVIDLDAEQRWEPGPLPRLVLSRTAGEPPTTLVGLLTAGDGRAWRVTVPLAPAPAE